jgi:hypothetical protein
MRVRKGKCCFHGNQHAARQLALRALINNATKHSRLLQSLGISPKRLQQTAFCMNQLKRTTLEGLVKLFQFERTETLFT